MKRVYRTLKTVMLPAPQGSYKITFKIFLKKRLSDHDQLAFLSVTYVNYFLDTIGTFHVLLINKKKNKTMV